jgi:phosphopantothenoylcysteine decarboxylase/phosphopantothenate--cysteine ligase
LLIGFALESENLLENGKEKLRKKNADLIVMNSIKDEGAGFESETNKISILDKDNKLSTFELKSKALVAKDIVDYIANYSK